MNPHDQAPAFASSGGTASAVRFSGFSLGKSLAGKLAFGCLCSAMVGVATNLPYIKVGILWTCHIILTIFGHPESPQSVEDRVRQGVAKGKIILDQQTGTVVSQPAPTPPLKPLEAAKRKFEAAATSTALAPVKEKVEEAGETAKEKLGEARDTVKEEADKVVAKIGEIGRHSPPGDGSTPPPEGFGGFRLPNPMEMPQPKPSPKYGPSLTQQRKRLLIQQQQDAARQALLRKMAEDQQKAIAANRVNHAALEAQRRRTLGGFQ